MRWESNPRVERIDVRFLFEARGTSSADENKRKKEGETNTSASLLAPALQNGRYASSMQFTVGGIQGEDAGKSDDDTVKRGIEGVHRVGGRRKRNGRNNVFILCAWLNVFRGLLLETRAAEQRGEKKGNGRRQETERERERGE